MTAPRLLDLLTRFVRFGQGGFDLGLVAVSSPARQAALGDRLADRLRAEGLRLARVEIDELEPDPLVALRRLEPADALLVTGLHGGHLELARRLNIDRDRLVAACPVPWIIAGHLAGLRVLADAAPDFVDFASLHEMDADRPPGAAAGQGAPHPDRRRGHRTRGGAAVGQGAPRRGGPPPLRGELDEARRVLAEEVLPTFEDLDDVRLREQIAALAQRLGMPVTAAAATAAARSELAAEGTGG